MVSQNIRKRFGKTLICLENQNSCNCARWHTYVSKRNKLILNKKLQVVKRIKKKKETIQRQGKLGIDKKSLIQMLLLLLSHFSRVWLSVTPWTAACQAPLSMGFSRQEYWSGLPFPSPTQMLLICKRVELFSVRN